MSNYDDLLRKNEQEYHFDTSQKDKHWNNMSAMLNAPNSPSLPKTGMGNFTGFIKWLLIIGGIAAVSLVVYNKLNKENKKFNGYLKPSNVESQFFTINSDKDEVIKTSHASILKIKKGTFLTDKPVTIEIKEVFTPDEIMQSGLTTASDRKPLKSTGMLYFNATVEGATISPYIPINTFILAKEKDSEMQIFKGEILADSTVNWVEPVVIKDTIKESELFKGGKALYNSKCASCHRIFTSATGPALRNFQLRGPWKNQKNIISFINNPSAFIVNDKYTQDLKNKYGSMMTGFADLQDTDIKSLLTYINNISQDKYSETEGSFIISDSSGYEKEDFNCGADTSYYSIKNDFEEYDTTGWPEVIPDSQFTDTIINYHDETDEYEGIYRQGYEFEITENGWYNIDAFLKENDNTVKNVSLTAELFNGESLPYNVYLFVPSERIFQTYSSKKGNKYIFSFEDGKLPLPLRYRAVIIAFGSSGKKVMYGAAEFTIQMDQQIKVELKETTAEKLQYVLNSKNIDGIKIEAIEKEMVVMPIPCDGPQKDSARADTTSYK